MKLDVRLFARAADVAGTEVPAVYALSMLRARAGTAAGRHRIACFPTLRGVASAALPAHARMKRPCRPMSSDSVDLSPARPPKVGHAPLDPGLVELAAALPPNLRLGTWRSHG